MEVIVNFNKQLNNRHHVWEKNHPYLLVVH